MNPSRTIRHSHSARVEPASNRVARDTAARFLAALGMTWGVLAVAVALVAAAAAPSVAQESPPDKLRVVVSILPQACFVERVGG